MKNLYDQSLRRVLLLAFLCCLNLAAFSQTALNGTVTDPEGNQLVGVTVSNQTQGHVTKTDEQGEFSVQAKVSDVIAFSSIGYQSHKLTLANLGSVRISLNPTGEDLEEVVVLGYGSIKKSNLTGSVSRLDKRVLETGVRSNPASALAGTIPGLRVQ
ncbi:carboxypeptidase-like regulatory domain-containing protein [Sphingobacterium sp.]|uniref:carboxypeptidase-like regulatory domain-containing protein n=1 Tax=Sphingobacterium sp. TaxID=341027 RepID=UPI0028AD0BB2|nr:carboxypeptidase-like regulatory domain-containing protein [Sphingobacterium sp.]